MSRRKYLIMTSYLFKLIVAVLSIQSVVSFIVPQGHQVVGQSAAKVIAAKRINVDDVACGTSPVSQSLEPWVKRIRQIATTAAVVVSTSPLMVLAEEADDYEYGAVNAPIGIAWAGGVLAILTALLPIALRGGEEAFEEMKERDAGKWGTGDSSSLNRRRK
jgi:hypothetical protein